MATKQADDLSASLDRIEAMLADIRDELEDWLKFDERLSKAEKAIETAGLAKGGAS